MIIEFKSKPSEHCIIVDGKAVIVYGVKVPVIKRSHCDMNLFRNSKTFGSYANSDLFLSMLARFMRENKVVKVVDIENPPSYCTVKKGFMSVVSIDLDKV